MEIERDDSEDESPDKRFCTETNLPLRSREDVWEAFGFNDSQRKKLPSKTDRLKGQATAKQRAHLAQIVARTATRVAEILFPADTNTLLQAVGDRLQAKNADVEQQFDKLLTTAGKVLATSPKTVCSAVSHGPFCKRDCPGNGNLRWTPNSELPLPARGLRRSRLTPTLGKWLTVGRSRRELAVFPVFQLQTRRQRWTPSCPQSELTIRLWSLLSELRQLGMQR